ncbi:hypothetical protein D3C79_876240 [compost metagenome]
MPGFTRLGLNHHALAVITQHAAATAGHVQHQRIDITGQQQVAATADDQHRQPALLRLGQRFAHLVIIMHLAEMPGLDVNAEGIERLERNLLLPQRCHNRPLISTTNAWHATSIRSSTCSKPAAPP